VEREITKNPVENLENPKIERKVKKTLTPDELKKVLNQFETSTFHGYRNYVITRILLDTGMRNLAYVEF
jgi:integrase/recombinase XerD